MRVVGEKEIAQLAGCQENTVHQWAKRGMLPAPDGYVSGRPAWLRTTIATWQQETGRDGALRSSILALMRQHRSPWTIEAVTTSLQAGAPRLRARQVQVVMTDLMEEGLLSLGRYHRWSLTGAAATAG